MNNVFQLPTRGVNAPLVDDSIYLTPTHVMQHAKHLHTLGILSNPAWAIACQALYFLAETQRTFVVMKVADMMNRHVTYDGNLLAGSPKPEDDTALLRALQELHEVGGILNSLDKQFFNQNDNPRQHFSIPHPMRKPLAMTAHTPIYFRLSKMHPLEFTNMIEGISTQDTETEDELVIIKV